MSRHSNFTSRPLQAVVDVAAMAHNLAQAKIRAGSRPVWAVVKANAYGHGIKNAVHGFAQADGLALLEIDEAQRARDAGWRKPILLLEGLFEASDVAAVQDLGLTVVVHCDEHIEMLARSQVKTRIAVYLKMDSGMNRLGFAQSRAPAALQRLQDLEQVQVVALMTHLANSDAAVPGAPDVAGQHAALVKQFPNWQGAWSVSNSAALFLHESRGAEWVRPGITLYGASPSSSLSSNALGLRPAMCLRARILAIRELQRGDCVGYGSTWRAQRSSRIAVVSCGYADGYPRQMPEGSPVWLGGQRVPLVGRVSMDMLTVDVTDVAHAVVGMPVEIWGSHVTVDEIAQRVGTVGYELLAGLPARVRETSAVNGVTA